MKHTKIMRKLMIVAVAAAAMLFAGCEKVSLPENPNAPTTVGDGSALLHINVSPFEIVPFETRATVNDVCTRISYALFRKDGSRAMNTKSQTSDAAGFGTLDVNIAPGEYVLVTVAHSGSGNCTISSPSEVKFANNKLTDTFMSCDELTVGEGEQSASVTVTRCVAMVRIVLDDPLPDTVKRMKLYYTGGSSTLDTTTGYGCVNSRQTEIVDVDESAYSGGSTYSVFTFPHDEHDTLKLTLTALDADGEAVAERELTDIPVVVGKITQYTGRMFGSGASGMQVAVQVGSTDWTQVDYKF